MNRVSDMPARQHDTSGGSFFFFFVLLVFSPFSFFFLFLDFGELETFLVSPV